MKTISDEQYRMKKAAEAKLFFTMDTLEGQKVGHMEPHVLDMFMRENGYRRVSGTEFSNGNIRMAMDKTGTLHKVSGATGAFNLKTYLSNLAGKSSPSVTEKQLGAKDEQGPESLTEKQLDKDRKGEEEVTTEKQLKSVRTASSNKTQEVFWCLLAGMPQPNVAGKYQLQPADLAEIENMAVASGGKSVADLTVKVKRNQLPVAYQGLWDKYHHDDNSGTILPLSPSGVPKTSGFNFKSYLQKHAHYEGVQGYWVAQTRAWSNCTKCKRDAGKSAQEAWQECINEYGGKKSNEEWSYEYASDVNDKMKKAAGSDSKPVTEKQLGAKDDQGPESLTEKQIEKDHKGEEEVTTEKQLGKVRTASADQVTEGQISGDRVHDEPDTLTEKQIEKDRKDGDAIPTEKRLEKVRKEAQQLQMGMYWERIREKQHEGLTPGQAVMEVLSEMERDGDNIVVKG